MNGIPTLETRRLILRAHRLEDFDAYAEFWAMPEVVRFISGVPMTREGAWGRMLRVNGMWHLMGFGFLAIEEKETGRLLGEAGFQDMRRGFEPSIEGTLETGWALIPSAHGKGYATEAMGALIAWAETHFPDRRMTCIISPENEASLRVASKFGFREFARSDYHGPIVVLSRENAGSQAA
ncbi:GNAT family N-acetyltransferase [Rhizobium sp. LC145]|jgi:RimJ/RimL family protein N-acetyltransferase|uniref:GNAT family N-acetyltransferase n=1 Tax=Rhizobium sp. LC145 TaxID=1120688 RepID=UPI00062A26FE|nr:GNAT family N-acetyltransferase [Rhizobium sp. LC145]KKX34328.1 GNAT family acetyltransferase [Rhizobium sp. LC145]TKT65540.1 GNAT family N-acetyltransferase [Rhizobiaceae bacterium LC148]